jgi:hypothetical protein
MTSTGREVFGTRPVIARDHVDNRQVDQVGRHIWARIRGDMPCSPMR